MKNVSLSIAAALAAVAVTACSQSSVVPAIKTTVDPVAQTSLQFAVGTANIAGVVGLNTVETLRQSSGPDVGASVLANAPTITGPAGFVVPPAVDAYGDAETNTISANEQTNLNVQSKPSTFNPLYSTTDSDYDALASSLGFLPAQEPNSIRPNLFPYVLPFYAGQNAALSNPANGQLCVASQETAFNTQMPAATDEQLCYVGGPPSFVAAGHASTQDGTFNAGDPGFNLGFVDFQAAPVTGSYSLSVVIPTGVNATSGAATFGTKAVSANLGSLTALPSWSTAPTFASDGAGGGTITTHFAGGGGVTEEYVELVNQGPGACQSTGAAPFFYTFKVTPGTATIAVPDSIGASRQGTAQPHTLCTAAQDTTATGDAVAVYGFAADYPLFASAFPQSSGQVSPAISGANGQADITTSVASNATE